MKIIYKNEDNSISIITPTQEALALYSIEAIETDNRERYITFRSTEYKEKYKGVENA